MNKQFITFGIAILLVAVVGLSGCFENKPSTTTLSAKSLNLTLDDLPQGYVECVSSNSSPEIENPIYKPRESDRKIFALGEILSENWPKSIDSMIFVFNSTQESRNFFNNHTGNFFTGGSIFEGANNTIGEESRVIKMWDSGFNEFIAYGCYFRISSVVVIVLYIYLDYSFTTDLAKIIEQRIYDALE